MPPYEEPLEAHRAGGVATFNDNVMKPGVFGANRSHRLMATHAETPYELSRRHTRRIAQIADRPGFEAMLPAARYRGTGRETVFGRQIANGTLLALTSLGSRNRRGRR
ncbi:hypothetical protein ACFYY8_09995 [Streptosporangium sp. NPDC001559]|uniref:hypothetical protein n=1 Tax=Streptosporangium sp. NPDC001559 TaxID=3366187 RepID=UPI0036F05187